MIPQDLVRRARCEHKGVGRMRDAIRIRVPREGTQKNAWTNFRRRPVIPRIAGGEEGAADGVHAVVNHPQSLWISLWVSFRVFAQVTYRKGFFFDRSNFERSVFQLSHQGLSLIFPLSRSVCPRAGAIVHVTLP